MTGSTASDDMVLVDPIQENRSGSYDFLLTEFSPWTPEQTTQQTDVTPILLAAGVGATIVVLILFALRRRK